MTLPRSCDLAHADVDDVRVRLGDRDCADRGGLEEADRTTARHVTPPSVVFHNAAAGRAEVVLERTRVLPATAIDRPPRAGPIERHRSPENSAGSTVAAVPAPGRLRVWTVAAMAATSASSTMQKQRKRSGTLHDGSSMMKRRILSWRMAGTSEAELTETQRSTP